MLVSGIGMFRAEQNRRVEGHGIVGMQSSQIMNERRSAEHFEKNPTIQVEQNSSSSHDGFVSRVLGLLKN